MSFLVQHRVEGSYRIVSKWSVIAGNSHRSTAVIVNDGVSLFKWLWTPLNHKTSPIKVNFMTLIVEHYHSTWPVSMARVVQSYIVISHIWWHCPIIVSPLPSHLLCPTAHWLIIDNFKWNDIYLNIRWFFCSFKIIWKNMCNKYYTHICQDRWQERKSRKIISAVIKLKFFLFTTNCFTQFSQSVHSKNYRRTLPFPYDTGCCNSQCVGRPLLVREDVKIEKKVCNFES